MCSFFLAFHAFGFPGFLRLSSAFVSCSRRSEAQVILQNVLYKQSQLQNRVEILEKRNKFFMNGGVQIFLEISVFIAIDIGLSGQNINNHSEHLIQVKSFRKLFFEKTRSLLDLKDIFKNSRLVNYIRAVALTREKPRRHETMPPVVNKILSRCRKSNGPSLQ